MDCKIPGIDPLHVCRICLQTSKEVKKLFSTEDDSNDILEKIHACFNINITLKKHFPSVICANCIIELDIAYNFHRNCITFDERFNNLSKSTLEITKEIEIPIKELKIEDIASALTEDSCITNIYTPTGTNEVEINVDKYNCTICNKSLKSKVSLLKHHISMHQKRKHSGKVTGFGANRRYHCTKCSYSTPHSQTLANHMRRHNGDRPYNCECGKSFTQSSSLAAHKKTHSNVTYYTCATCGKQFKHAFTLKKHLQVHEDGKYSCDICHKNLKSKQSLQDHVHRHYNIRNFSCEDCGDTFVTCSELINHKKKHSLVKKIECHFCGYKTHTKNSLILHLKRHAGDKSHKCGSCELSFYTSSDLRRHNRVHTREKPFSCPICAQRFAQSTSLNKHMNMMHGLDYKWGDLKLKDSKKIKSLPNKLSKQNI